MRKPHYLTAMFVAQLVTLTACQTGEKTGGGGGDEASVGKEAAAPAAPSVSSTRVTFTNSWSNSPLTSQTVSASKAEQEVEKLKGAGSKDKHIIEGRIAAARLARKAPSEIFADAKKLAELEMEQGAGRSIAPEVKLDLALAAVQAKNYALAEYLVQELSDAKNAKVKAAAYNILGVIALRDERIPEAVLYFKEALKAVNNYRPALLNLGFAALKGGDAKTAKDALGGMQNDWFVQYGLISVARVEGNDARAGELCEEVLKKQPTHAGALFNCALFEYQNRHNVAKAKELLGKAGQAKGEAGWNERAYRLIAQIDADEAQGKQEAAHRAAEKAAADKAAADKAAADKAAAAAKQQPVQPAAAPGAAAAPAAESQGGAAAPNGGK